MRKGYTSGSRKERTASTRTRTPPNQVRISFEKIQGISLPVPFTKELVNLLKVEISHKSTMRTSQWK